MSQNETTLDNARIWDTDEMTQVLSATEEQQPYFQFSGADLDRYDIGGSTVQTLNGVRELNPSQLPSSTWTNSHLVYTHGYGVDSAQANEHNGDSPSYLLSDIPPKGQLSLTQPDVYFGEGFSGYAVVDTKVAEQEQSANGSTTTKYSGNGGVNVSSFTRKLAFALRFGDFNLLYSSQLTGQSRLLYLRDIQERVQTAAPFLQWDADPYSVVLNGRVEWVLDGYTTTNRYPNSQSINPGAFNPGSGLGGDINYVRNSVKATVDAYDGTIHFYVVDPSDPIIRTYRKAFPDLFQDAKDMPPGLSAHLRYPEDMFEAQTEQYNLYHMTNTQDFFQKSALWDVAPSPDTTGATTVATTPSGGNNGGRNSTLASSGNPIDPQYLMMQLPGEHGQQFVLERPFVPRTKSNQLSAFMIAGNDGSNYGKLTLYTVPDQSLAPSPVRAATSIDADPNISKIFSLLDQRGSTVVRGAAQLIPIDNSIFYVRPIYVVGTTGGQPLPRWHFVAVTYGENAVLDTSVSDAVDNLLAGTIPAAESNVLNGNTNPNTTPTTTPTTTPNTTPGTGTQPPSNASVASLISEANNLYTQAIRRSPTRTSRPTRPTSRRLACCSAGPKRSRRARRRPRRQVRRRRPPRPRPPRPRAPPRRPPPRSPTSERANSRRNPGLSGGPGIVTI